METRILKFEENEITFQLSKDNGMMINATEMAKPFGKKVEAFMRNEGTISFIEEALKSENSRFLIPENNRNSGYSDEEIREFLVDSRQKSGTFMHRVLALKFAAWLDPKFELWVYSTIEKLLFGKYVERDQSHQRTVALQKELDTLRDAPAKTGEQFERYLEVERLLRVETTIRQKLTTETVSEMRELFE